MKNYKTRIPGIDRSSEAKNPPSNKSAALQKGTKEYTPLGFMGIIGNLAGNMLGKKLGGDKFASGQTGGGKALDALGGPLVGFARGIFGKKR